MSDTILSKLKLPASVADAASGILLGLSGGVDSIVLLELLASPPRPFPALPLHAIHVHHGLDPAADAWATHCQACCDTLGVPLQIVHVAVTRASGLGREAAARAARHAAFVAALGDGEVLTLAHHRDDQAETFLLRALRASGP
ncbi:MAG: ATP-binding protein, partial [Luteimonas sp.]